MSLFSYFSALLVWFENLLPLFLVLFIHAFILTGEFFDPLAHFDQQFPSLVRKVIDSNLAIFDHLRSSFLH